jgi:predicted TIM-barrel fold metal-dependent hydrolase
VFGLGATVQERTKKRQPSPKSKRVRENLRFFGASRLHFDNTTTRQQLRAAAKPWKTMRGVPWTLARDA